MAWRCTSPTLLQILSRKCNIKRFLKTQAYTEGDQTYETLMNTYFMDIFTVHNLVQT